MSSFVATQVSFNQSNALKPLINKLFAPGILYNSIKSGLAVDYPTVNDAKKLSPTNFYHKTQLFFDSVTGSWAMDIDYGLWYSASV